MVSSEGSCAASYHMGRSMEDKILLAHGSGGKLSHDLVKDFFVPLFDNTFLSRLDDSAVIELGGRLASLPTVCS